MTREEFQVILSKAERPVMLLEGTRELPEEDAAKLEAVGRWLAETFPQARFRTGNAEGSDAAFARGVAAVDPARLEYVLPYGGHRKKALATHSYQITLTDLPKVAEARAARDTAEASPAYGSLLAKRETVPSVGAKARYLLRDTLKVTGSPENGLPPATVGLFYVNAADPMKGGTGHTIRVCCRRGVPVAFQEEWMGWFPGRA
jgi:hypothetical protein